MAVGAFHIPDPLAGGTAVVLICAGVSLAMQAAFPAIFAFSLFLMAWMVVLAIAALALTLYTGSVCCRTSWGRVVFSLIVGAVLVLGWPLWFPRESSLANRVASPGRMYGGATFLLALGTFSLAWLARRNREHSRWGALRSAFGGGPDQPTGNHPGPPDPSCRKPAFSPARVVVVLAALLFLSFLIFLAWLFSTPHR